MRLIELTFKNYFEPDAPIINTVYVAPDSVASVMAWYGSYYAGDPYVVYANGREVQKDANGEIEPIVIDLEVVK